MIVVSRQTAAPCVINGAIFTLPGGGSSAQFERSGAVVPDSNRALFSNPRFEFEIRAMLTSEAGAQKAGIVILRLK